MTIAICDDETVFRNELKSILFKYKKEKHIHLDILEFDTGEAFLNSNHRFDIVFLDYQMPGLDGMEVARKLRKENSMCSIIFITAYPHFVFESFEVSPYRFFKKPIEVTKLLTSLDSYIEKNKLHAPIVVNIDGELKSINSSDIVYVEGDGKYCNIRTTYDTIHSSKTLVYVYNKLPQHCFYRIHKSYVINMYCISSISGNTVVLTNGEKALISRNYIADFKKTYKDFIKNFYLRL